MTILETERLILRHLTMDDLDDLYRIYQKPDVVKYILGYPTTYKETKEQLRSHIEEDYPKYGFGWWATVLKDEGKLIGRCGLLAWDNIENRKEVEVDYLLDEDYWGKGLATEVVEAIIHYGFNDLKMKRLISLIYSDNTASIKVAAKAGMSFEKDVILHGEKLSMYSIGEKIKD